MDLKINNQITAREIRLKRNGNSKTEIISLARALEIAKDENVDLIEINPNSSPPVCILIEYGKYKYLEEKKKTSAQKNTQKISEIQISPRIAEHDLDVKIESMKRILEKKAAKIKCIVRLFGREKDNAGKGIEILKQVRDKVSLSAIPEAPPKIEGNQIWVVFKKQNRV